MPLSYLIAFFIIVSIGVLVGILGIVFAWYFLLTQSDTAEACATRQRDYEIKRTAILSEKIYKRLNRHVK